jgi:hypothetical protein
MIDLFDDWTYNIWTDFGLKKFYIWVERLSPEELVAMI